MTANYLQELFKQYSEGYSKTEKKIAQYFLSLGSEVSSKTLEQLSNEIGVSKTAIFEFVKKHGFDGFQNFKIEIAHQRAPQKRTNELVVYSDISADDPPYVIAQKAIQSYKNLLDDLLNSLSEDLLNKVVNIILSSKELHFFGQGSSSIVAYDSYHKFIRSKFKCNYIQDHHMQISYSTKLGKGDCVFLFSHSGQTLETIKLAKIVAESEADLVVLTGNTLGELVQYTDLVFIIDTVEATFGSESLFSRNLYITIIDILYTAVMYNDEEKNKQSIATIRKALSQSKIGE